MEPLKALRERQALPTICAVDTCMFVAATSWILSLHGERDIINYYKYRGVLRFIVVKSHFELRVATSA
jgi:hypothetical protein